MSTTESDRLESELRRLREHVGRELKAGVITPEEAGELLGLEPGLIRAVLGRHRPVEAPNVADRPVSPEVAKGVTANRVMSAALKLSTQRADGKLVCPPHADLSRETGMPAGTVSATISKLRAQGRWPFASRKSPARPVPTPRKRGRKPDPPGTPRARPGSVTAKVLEAAVSLAAGSGKCPSFSAIGERSGVSSAVARTLATRLRRSGEWPFPYRCKPAMKPVGNGKAIRP